VLGEVADASNAAARSHGRFHTELARVGRRMRRDGRLDERMELPDAGGALAVSAQAVTGIVEDLVRPSKEVARVIGAVAASDLTARMSPDATTVDDAHRGELERPGQLPAGASERSARASRATAVPSKNDGSAPP
jgi:hypothetical protein